MFGYFLLQNKLPSKVMRKSKQKGVIIISVLLIVGVIAGLAVKYTADYQLSLARAESRWHSIQARAFLTGSESIVSLLFKSADIDPNTDYIGEPWSNEVPIIDEGISGYAQLVDATNKLNLNDLKHELSRDKPMGSPDRYSESQRRFIRLLQTFPELQITQQQAEGLLEAVVDWIDEDAMESGTYGAESSYYQGLATPYFAANQLFRSVEELRLVRGFDEMPELYIRLQPFITALPKADVGINLNTLDIYIQQAYEQDGTFANNLARSLGSQQSLTPLDDSQAIQLFIDRPGTGFSDLESFIEEWKKLMGPEELLANEGLNVKTQFFWLMARVQMGDQRITVKSLFERADTESGIKVISRADVYEMPAARKKDELKQTKLFSR